MRILVLQHLSIEHPGVFLDFWRAAGHKLTTIELDAYQKIPDLTPFDLLVVMGGPMDVWQEDHNPWIKLEKVAIRHWVMDLRRPYLGVCLGHQLLAVALGGAVTLMAEPEVGLGIVSVTEAGANDDVFRALAPDFSALHWHGASVSRVPEDALVLAGTAACPVQAMRWGRHAYGIQCHIEVQATTVGLWQDIPEYRASLDAILGAEAAADLSETVGAQIERLNATARLVNDAVLALAVTADRI